MRLPHQLVMFVGQAWLAEGATRSTPDHEHDEFAWWPREIDEWPAEAEEALRADGPLAVAVSSPRLSAERGASPQPASGR